MFFQNILYEIKTNLRAKEVLIWMVIFPICLGLFYKFAFGNLGKDGAAMGIKVAVVENTEDRFFHMFYDNKNESNSVDDTSSETEAQTDDATSAQTDGVTADQTDGVTADQTENSGKTENGMEKVKQMLDPTFCSEEEAYKLLSDGDVAGVIFINPVPGQTPASSDDTDFMSDVFGINWDQMKDFTQIGDLVRSTYEASSFSAEDINKQMDTMMKSYIPDTDISVKIKKNGSEQSTLKSYIEMFINMKKMATDIWNSNAKEKDTGAFDDIGEIMNGATIKETPLTDGNKDPLAMYMYNLIAMVSIFGSLAAMHISINNQANLSSIGMRRSCSGSPKWTMVLPELIGTYITHSACVLISVTFLKFVLQIDFGDKLLLVYLTGICGAIMGVSLGFFVGAIGRLSESAKSGIMMAVNMSLCFMSGLMIDSIRAIFSVQIPIVNALNPVAVVTDAMYYLNMDSDLSRYFGKLLTMGGFTVLFIVLGILFTRRKKYASL
ncbi:MAG: ABC transporter permease [Eubacterium sp.]|nr:ABC transporter permease [Eubacterium sp.]